MLTSFEELSPKAQMAFEKLRTNLFQVQNHLPEYNDPDLGFLFLYSYCSGFLAAQDLAENEVEPLLDLASRKNFWITDPEWNKFLNVLDDLVLEMDVV